MFGITFKQAAIFKNERRDKRPRLWLEALEARDVPSAPGDPPPPLFTDTFDWNGVAEATVTVTQDAPGYPGLYLWNYHITNDSFSAGISTFAVPVEDSTMVTNLGSNVSWSGSVGTLMNNTDLISWQTGGSQSPITTGNSADFWFTTVPADIALTNGIISDAALNSTPGGFVAAPIPPGAGLPGAPLPAILVATALDKLEPNIGLTSLREAITWVNQQNLPVQQFQVRFSSNPNNGLVAGTIWLGDLNSLPEVTSNIFINGTDLGIHIKRDNTKGDFRLLKGNNASTIKIAGLYLENGGGLLVANGGAISTDGVLSLQDCYISENEAVSGGGVYSSAGNLTIEGGSIFRNRAVLGGGVFHKAAPALSITNCDIYLNEAKTNPLIPLLPANGGGIFIGDRVALANIVDCAITGNSADNMGGGVYIAGSGTFTVETIIASSFISGNSALNGGGIAVAVGGVPLLRLQSNTVISYNSASSKGGGVYMGAGTFQYSYTIITNNLAGVGGGLYLVNGATWAGPYADPANSDISNNLADDWNQGAA